jgi:hypothetical protein
MYLQEVISRKNCVQVVACSKGYLHITVMLSKVYGPESQLPPPALGGWL